MTEIFDALTVAGETVSEEDRVVYLLASLPDSYNVLVTALEASENVPKLEVVTERILHQERKFRDRSDATPENAMISRKVTSGKQPSATIVANWGISNRIVGFSNQRRRVGKILGPARREKRPLRQGRRTSPIATALD